MPTKILSSNIVTAFNAACIGSKVQDSGAVEFIQGVIAAVDNFDWSTCRVPGQAFIMTPELAPYVQAGVGMRTSDPNDYLCREHRGRVDAYLKRDKAAATSGCAVVVYTADAYLADPEIEPGEAERVRASGCTHVIVAVLAFAGPPSQLSPYRFTSNLAGGNKEALEWSAEEIRNKAHDVIAYDSSWCVVAD